MWDIWDFEEWYRMGGGGCTLKCYVVLCGASEGTQTVP